MLRLLLITAFIWISPVSAYAQQADPDRLEDIRKQEEAAKAREAKLASDQEKIRNEITKLKSDLVRAAADAETYEKESRKSAEKLASLTREEARLKTAQFSDRETVMHLIGALQRLENNPPPALIVVPSDAANAARAARLMSEISKNLKTHAQSLSARLTELSLLREDISVQRETLAANEKDVAKRRNNVKRLVGEKSELEKTIAADLKAEKARMAELAKEADTLKDLIASVETESLTAQPRINPGPEVSRTYPRLKPRANRPPEPLTLPPDTMRFADARGGLRTPVRGQIDKKFSSAHRGITLSTRSQAQIISPYSGRVEFTGPFKNYANVIILNVGDGYFIVMTGIGEIYTELGEDVTIGQPLGLMPSSTTQKAKLYIEFWKDGAPINPMPWLGTALAQAG